MVPILIHLTITINTTQHPVHGDMDCPCLCTETIDFQDTYVLPLDDDDDASNRKGGMSIERVDPMG